MTPIGVGVAVLFAALVLAFGCWGAVRPRSMQQWMTQLPTQRLLALAVVSRAIFGISLLVAASASLFPAAFQGLGALALIVAVSLAIAGTERLQALVTWWTDRSPNAIRAGAAFAAGIGAFILYGLLEPMLSG